MLRIYIGKGKFAIIDDDDAQRVLQYKWHCSSHPYAQKHSDRTGQRPIYMHRFILDAPPDKVVDHVNGDTLDNRKENLRLATRAENLRNRPKERSNTSGYKGVWRNKKRWAASITYEGKQYHLGTYDTPEEAAQAYDAGAREYHGEFAALNFPAKPDELARPIPTMDAQSGDGGVASTTSPPSPSLLTLWRTTR